MSRDERMHCIAKYKSTSSKHKVQMSRDGRMYGIAKYESNTPSEHKVRMSCDNHMFSLIQKSCSQYMYASAPAEYKSRMQNIHRIPLIKTNHRLGTKHKQEHTPYGPYNLPHMVLYTPKGPDHA